MGATERAYDRGTRQGGRWLRIMGEEFRTVRLSLGLAQRHVAESAHISQSVYGRIERGVLPHLSILLAARIATVLGLELSARVYPGGSPIRDTAHAERLSRLLAHVGSPLTYRTDVPLPPTTEHPEHRAWDAVLRAGGERTAVELEMRLYDVQAQTRRLHLKERDDRPDHLLLVLADTGANRRALDGFEILLSDLPRLRTANVLRTLRTGHHPPTGRILL